MSHVCGLVKHAGVKAQMHNRADDNMGLTEQVGVQGGWEGRGAQRECWQVQDLMAKNGMLNATIDDLKVSC